MVVAVALNLAIAYLITSETVSVTSIALVGLSVLPLILLAPWLSSTAFRLGAAAFGLAYLALAFVLLLVTFVAPFPSAIVLLAAAALPPANEASRDA